MGAQFTRISTARKGADSDTGPPPKGDGKGKACLCGAPALYERRGWGFCWGCMDSATEGKYEIVEAPRKRPTVYRLTCVSCGELAFYSQREPTAESRPKCDFCQKIGGRDEDIQDV